MSKALQANSEEALLQEWQESQVKIAKKGHNTLKLINNSKDPDYGKFFAIRYELDTEAPKESWKEVKEEVDLSKAEFFPVKCRTQIMSPFKDNKPLYRIDEQDDSWVVLKDAEGKIIEEGLYFDKLIPEAETMKMRYNLKYSQSVYCFYNGIAYKMIIKSNNVSSWFKVWGKIAKQPQTMKIIRMPEEQVGTNMFYPLVFDLTGNMVELKDAVPLMRQIDTQLAKYYEEKAKKQSEASEEATVQVIDEDYATDLPFA